MGMKCKCLSEEYVGSDKALICRKSVHQRDGFECSKRTRRWMPTFVCKNIERITSFVKPEETQAGGTGNV